MPGRKDEIFQQDDTLRDMAREGRTDQALKAQRTKVENLNRAYWLDVYKARRAVKEDGRKTYNSVSEEFDIEESDLVQAVLLEEPYWVSVELDGEAAKPTDQYPGPPEPPEHYDPREEEDPTLLTAHEMDV